METLGRINGYLNLLELDRNKVSEVQIIKENKRGFHFTFQYEGNTYYFKSSHSNVIEKEKLLYNELVAEEIALDFGLPCVHYDLACCGDILGVLSKDYKKTNHVYIKASKFFHDFYPYFELNDEKKYRAFENCLEHIWDGFEIRFPHNQERIQFLMNKVVLYYLYDILTCQSDRHKNNWEIDFCPSKEFYDLSPLYDNERILVYDDTRITRVLLGVLESYSTIYRSIKTFRKVSHDVYTDIFKEKLWIIHEENLQMIFKRIAERTECLMPEALRESYLESYEKHQKNLKNTLL